MQIAAIRADLTSHDRNMTLCGIGFASYRFQFHIMTQQQRHVRLMGSNKKSQFIKPALYLLLEEDPVLVIHQC